MKIGFCGTGTFANGFIPLFNAHPLVDEVVLADLDEDKLREKAERFGISRTLPSLDALCESDVDAIAIFSQPDRHGPQAVQALGAGKHVYSAVPSAATIEEVRAIADAAVKYSRIYMVGETSYYYPCTIFCRSKFQEGAFGHVVSSEAEYHHDRSHGSFEVLNWRYGSEWRRYANYPPLFYPTHSVSMVVSVTGAHVTSVSALGFTDRDEDRLYFPDDPVYQNQFSNETMLCRMSDGSMARFNEFRRVGHPGTVGMSMYGTEGSYEEQVGGQMWVTKDRDACVDVSEQLTPSQKPKARDDDPMDQVTSSDGTHLGISAAHEVSRLPREFAGLPNGHKGSHQFLVDDFVRAVTENRLPPNNIWQAARYLIPGLVGHESALKGGIQLEVPDLGDAPEW